MFKNMDIFWIEDEETSVFSCNRAIGHFNLSAQGIHDFKKYDLYANCILLKFTNIKEKEFRSYLMSNDHIFFSPKLVGEYNAIIYLLSSDPIELGKHLKEIKGILKDSLVSMDILPIEHLYKYKQFPEKELR